MRVRRIPTRKGHRLDKNKKKSKHEFEAKEDLRLSSEHSPGPSRCFLLEDQAEGGRSDGELHLPMGNQGVAESPDLPE